MGYNIKRLPYIKRSWKLQFISYDDNKRAIRDLSETEYARLGFQASMTYDQACARKDQLNAQGHIKRTEEKRVVISKRLDAEEKVLDAFLSATDVQEFEQTVLLAGLEAIDFAKRNKLESHWRKARRILSKLKFEPQDWDFHKRRFYEVFAHDAMSPSYVKKIIGVLNLWGRFHCRKYGKFFVPLKSATGREKERIADAYYEENGQGNESDPITPAQLESVRSQMAPEWYNWFYLSIWFGLRPGEVNNLKKPQGPKTWHVGVENGVPFLAVYQTKLTGIARDKRTKFIPCIVAEQVAALKIIESGQFQQASHVRHIRKYFGENTTNYGGRKGFEDLMRSLGQAMEDFYQWLGHQNMNRTYRDYKNKKSLRFRPVVRER